MGESNQITLTSNGPAGPDAPDAPNFETTSSTPGSVQLSTDPPPVESPAEAPTETQVEAVEPTEAADRPEWLDPKFSTPEDLQQAYNALQQKMGSDEPQEATPGVSAEALAPFAEEYYSQGTLSDDSFTKLEGLGLSRDLVTAFMDGQQAVQAAELQQMYSHAGGEEGYQKALAWAAQNLAPEEIAAYNDQVESGDINTATVAVKGLMAMYNQGSPTASSPNLMQSEPTGPGGIAPYESVAQLVADMQTKDYKTDPAFRQKVAQRLERTDVL